MELLEFLIDLGDQEAKEFVEHYYYVIEHLVLAGIDVDIENSNIYYRHPYFELEYVTFNN